MQDLETPRMLYRAGGLVLLESGAYTTRIVADPAELASALADGWFLDQYAAKDAVAAPLLAAAEPVTEPMRVKRPYNRKAMA